MAVTETEGVSSRGERHGRFPRLVLAAKLHTCHCDLVVALSFPAARGRFRLWRVPNDQGGDLPADLPPPTLRRPAPGSLARGQDFLPQTKWPPGPPARFPASSRLTLAIPGILG